MAQSLHDLCTEVISGQKDLRQHELHFTASSERSLNKHIHTVSQVRLKVESISAILGLLSLPMIHEMLPNNATYLLEKYHVECP